MRHYRIQLADTVTREAIQTAGGKAYVAAAGSSDKVALKDETGADLANPVALTNGIIEFYVADAVTKVDLYVQSPTGHFLVTKNVLPSGPNTFFVDKSKAETTMVIPFSIADTTANTETNTGFTVPAKGAVLPSPTVDVTVLDDTQTIDVGTLSSASGDADGFIDGASVATAVRVKGSLANGAVTLGALLKVQDSANAGDAAPEQDVSSAGKAITYTLSAGSDTAKGFILLPVSLAAASL